MDLPSKDAASVQRLFATQHQVLSTTSALSLAAVAVFGLTFVSAVQNGYERVWQLPAGPWRHAWRRTIRRAVWLAVLTAYLYAVAQSRDLLDGGTAQTAVRVVLILAAGLVFFWWGQSFLLGRRVPALRLLPGALLTVGGLAGLRWFSGLVFSRMIVDNAVSYGVVGTVLVVESWLIGVGFVVFGGALLGRRLVCPEAAEAPDLPGNTES
jgi:membrane protein